MILPFAGDWKNTARHEAVACLPMWISPVVIFVIAIFAETNRLPFDLPEAETELVGGYHPEYGSIKLPLSFSSGNMLP